VPAGADSSLSAPAHESQNSPDQRRWKWLKAGENPFDDALLQELRDE